MHTLVPILMSPKLPDPKPLRHAGWSRFDLQLAFHRCLFMLDRHKFFSIGIDSKVNDDYADKVETATRNFKYLENKL